MRRPLLIALGGLMLVVLLEWDINNDIRRYQAENPSNQEYGAFLGGPVLLGFRDVVAWLWQWVHEANDVLLVIFTAALFLVTGLLVRYTKKLWRSTKDLVDETQKTSQKQLRAYVMPKAAIVNLQESTGVIPVKRFIQIEFKNFGQTPAVDAMYWLKATVKTYPWAAAAEKPNSSPCINISAIAPGDTFTVRVPMALIQEDTSGIHGGRDALYFFGELKYDDIFGRAWETNFRFIRRGQGWTGDGEMETCEDGNKFT